MNANIGASGGSSRGDGNERNPRPRPGVGIVLVVGDQLLGEQRNVVDRPREQPDMIEGARERRDAMA